MINNNTAEHPKRVGMDLLRVVQYLQQNGELTAPQKQNLVDLISAGMKTGDFTELIPVFVDLRWGSALKLYLDEAIEKIQKYNK